MQVVVGHSEDPDSKAASKSIIEQCKVALGGVKPNLALLFGDISYDFEHLRSQIKAEYPEIEIIGCSSHGEMSSQLGYAESSILAMMFDLKESVHPFLVKNLSKDTKNLIRDTVNKILDNSKGKPEFALIFPDVLTANIAHAIEGIQTVAGEHFPIVGGGASENYTFVKTYQVGTNAVISDGLSGAIFNKPLVFSSAEKHGMTSISPKHTITKAKGNLILEIDNKPALDVYQSYAGKDARNIYVHSFAFYEGDQFSIRSPFQMNPTEKSLGFGFEIKENSQIAVMQTNKEKALKAAKECVDEAVKNFSGKKIHCALVFSCSLRREVLGTDAGEEFKIVQKSLPKGTPIAGCYVYGEIGPFQHKKPADFYSETIVTAIIGE